MIKFFRHIRRSLIQKNQMGKYLKYAIGEILLVVIGILIALQINNWNENRLNALEEQAILSSLQSEISQNQDILTRDLKTHSNVLRLLKELNELIEPEPQGVSVERLDTLMYGLVGIPSYTPKEGVLNSVISSGKISLISNSKLNSDLASWHTLMNEYNQALNWNEQDVFEVVLPYMQDHYPLTRALKLFVSDYKTNSKFNFPKEEILSDMAFETIVAERIIDCNAALKTAKQLFTFQEDILELIDNELKD